MKAGITGHQKFDSTDTIAWVYNKLEDVILKCEIAIGYTSLAIGADQLFAEILKKNSIPYIAVIPAKNYELTFKEDDRTHYFYLLKSAQEVVQLAFNEPCEYAFYKAGTCISDLSDVVIAIWDGQKAKGLGGTGDIVEYTILKKKKIIHINPLTHKISQTFT